jgi:hypothetical protein
MLFAPIAAPTFLRAHALAQRFHCGPADRQHTDTHLLLNRLPAPRFLSCARDPVLPGPNTLVKIKWAGFSAQPHALLLNPVALSALVVPLPRSNTIDRLRSRCKSCAIKYRMTLMLLFPAVIERTFHSKIAWSMQWAVAEQASPNRATRVRHRHPVSGHRRRLRTTRQPRPGEPLLRPRRRE